MSINGATQKAFIEKIYREESLELDKALNIFYKTKSQRNVNNLLSMLRAYSNEGEIIFVENNSGKECCLIRKMSGFFPAQEGYPLYGTRRF